MDAYNLLNNVKPGFLRPQYPYNLVDPAKIILTQKKITIIAKQLKSKDKKLKSKKGGEVESIQITIYS